MHLRKPSDDVSYMEFWSIFDNIIDLPAVAGDVDCPDIVISDLPSSITIDKVLGMLQFRAIENTDFGWFNGINGNQNIRIKKSTGTWGIDDVVFLPLIDAMWFLLPGAKEVGGGVWIVDDANGCKSEVDRNATYNVRFENALVISDNLRLHDIKVGLKIFFY